MSNLVHSHAVRVIMCCALILINALPTVVRSENTPSDVGQSELASTTVMDATTTALTTAESAPPAPYTVDVLETGGRVVGDFVVGPGKIDETIKPGESKVVEMTVANRTGMRRQFKVTVEDAQGSTDIEQPIVLLGDDRGPYSLKDYISVPHTTFELNDGERARVPVTISIPPDAEPGGHYGSVLVQTLTVEDRNTSGENPAPRSAIISRIGTLFFITVPGGVERSGMLTEFATVPEKHYFQSGPIHFGILFKNIGGIHLAPYGEIQIKNIFDEEVGFIELEPWFVLPKSQRLREITWNRDVLFGKYTATVQINRSYDDVIDTMTYSFWVLPWKILAGAFAIIFIVMFGIRTFFSRFEFKRKSK